MDTGHVFVVKGSIGKLVADAAVVSTDDVFMVQSLARRRHVREAIQLGASPAG